MAAQQGPNKRTMVILCVILGLLAVVALVRYAGMATGGGDDGGTTAEPAASATPAPTVPPSTPSTTPTTTAPGQPTVPTGDFDTFVTRDPFEPVVQVGTSDAGSTSGEAVATGGAAGGAAAAGTVAEPGKGGTSATGTSASSGPSLTVVDVVAAPDGTMQATVKVGSDQYTVSPGQTFATSYKVVSLSGTCGQFLYGDSAFQLCEGQSK